MKLIFKDICGEMQFFKPVLTTTMVSLSDSKNGIKDNDKVLYSNDGRRLLKSTNKMIGAYNIALGTEMLCDNAFAGCTNLGYVNIPNSITTIGREVFSKCKNLKSVNIPNSVTQISAYAFRDCEELTPLIIGKNVKEIYVGTFVNCKKIKDVVIPDSVEEIWQDGFAGCDELETVTIGKGVTKIGYRAFAGCNKLKDITISNPIAPDCDSYAFSSTVFNTCTLHIPTGTNDEYSQVPVWKNFKNINFI